MDLDNPGALREAGVDGWLFCDFHHRDAMAYRILGLDITRQALTSGAGSTLIPAEGQPIKLAHRVEPGKLETRCRASQEHYLAWTELHAKLKTIRRAAAARSPCSTRR